MVTVGLAQNFGALRALATEGIQQGHMALHARNIATAAGAPPHAISEVTAYMIANQRINLQAAQVWVLRASSMPASPSSTDPCLQHRWHGSVAYLPDVPAGARVAHHAAPAAGAADHAGCCRTQHVLL